MSKYLVDKYRIDPLAIDESGIQTDLGDAQIDVSGYGRYVVLDRNSPLYITGTRVTFYVPFTGDSELFKCRPSAYSLNPPRADVRSSELAFTYDVTHGRAFIGPGYFPTGLGADTGAFGADKTLTWQNSTAPYKIERVKY